MGVEHSCNDMMVESCAPQSSTMAPPPMSPHHFTRNYADKQAFATSGNHKTIMHVIKISYGDTYLMQPSVISAKCMGGSLKLSVSP